MRLLSIATWTSGEPVSPSTVAYSAMIGFFWSVVSATWAPPVRRCAPGVFDTRADRHTAGSAGVMDQPSSAARSGAAGGSTGERVVEEAQQLVGVERLGRGSSRRPGPARQACASSAAAVSMTTGSSRPPAGARMPGEHLVAVHARHHHVEHDAVRAARPSTARRAA